MYAIGLLIAIAYQNPKNRPTKRAATVLKVKSKTTFKGKTSPSQFMTVCLNGTLSRIIAFKMVRNFRMHAVNATFFTFPLFNIS